MDSYLNKVEIKKAKIMHEVNEAMRALDRDVERAKNDELIVDTVDVDKDLENMYLESLTNSINKEPVKVSSARNTIRHIENELHAAAYICLTTAIVILAKNNIKLENNLDEVDNNNRFFQEQSLDNENIEVSQDNDLTNVDSQNLNEIYNIGGKFILNDDAKIYTNYEFAGNPESLDAKMDENSPYFEADVPRTITGIGYQMPDGTLQYASERDTELALEQAGGEAVSVGGFIAEDKKDMIRFQMPDGTFRYAGTIDEELEILNQGGEAVPNDYIAEDGYYNINEIIDNEEYKMGGR